jgi:glycosyltransferase involved in cell wall biosynthesis
LVLITRRFWPLVGGAEVVMSNLAAALEQSGAHVTLLTAAWQPDWPVEFLHRGVRTIRLSNPSLRVWGTLRYMQAVASWLRTHRDSFDLVYVSMLKHDAYAALAARRKTPFPVVLRTEGAGTTGDVCWQREARCGRRIRRAGQTADAIVAPSRVMQDELLDAGYSPERIHYLPNGVPVPGETTTQQARAQARANLAAAHPHLTLPSDAEHRRACALPLPGAAHPHLALPSDASLAVYTGRLITAKGLEDLTSRIFWRRPTSSSFPRWKRACHCRSWRRWPAGCRSWRPTSRPTNNSSFTKSMDY